MHRDTVIGLVGVLILVAAMVGVFSYEQSQAADVDGALILQSVPGPSLEGTTAVGEVTGETVALNQTGMTNVTFTLRWTAGTGVDTLALAVVPPNGTTTEQVYETQGDTGELTVTVPVPNAARSGETGVGAWQVSVQFVSASTGLPTEPPVPVPNTTDSQVSWTLETSVQHWGDPSAGDDS